MPARVLRFPTTDSSSSPAKISPRQLWALFARLTPGARRIVLTILEQLQA